MVRFQGSMSLIVVFNLKYKNGDILFKLDRKSIEIFWTFYNTYKFSRQTKFIKINNVPNTSVMNLKIRRILWRNAVSLDLTP